MAPARKQELNLSHVIFLHSVSSLSQAYTSLLPMNQQGICSTLLTFLESQHTTTGNMGQNLKWVFSIPVHSSKSEGRRVTLSCSPVLQVLRVRWDRKQVWSGCRRTWGHLRPMLIMKISPG